MDRAGSLKRKHDSMTNPSSSQTARPLNTIVARYTVDVDAGVHWIVTRTIPIDVDSPTPEKIQPARDQPTLVMSRNKMDRAPQSRGLHINPYYGTDDVDVSSTVVKGLQPLTSRLKTDQATETHERQDIRRIQNDASSPSAHVDGASPATAETQSAPKMDKSGGGNELPALLDGDECTICFEPYRKVEDMVFLRCFHFYHKDCLDEWMKIDDTCPVCRCKAVIEGNLQ